MANDLFIFSRRFYEQINLKLFSLFKKILIDVNLNNLQGYPISIKRIVELDFLPFTRSPPFFYLLFTNIMYNRT